MSVPGQGVPEGAGNRSAPSTSSSSSPSPVPAVVDSIIKIRTESGEYEVTNKKIGEGSFGAVVKGWRVGHPEELLAVKDIPTNMSSAAKLLVEAERLVQLFRRHAPGGPDPTHIVQVHDWHKSERNFLIVMEFCNGGDLSNCLLAHRVPP
eukprot:RCo039101